MERYLRLLGGALPGSIMPGASLSCWLFTGMLL